MGVGAVVAWTAISAFAGVDVHVSLLGNYGSYDGLYTAAAFGVIMMAAAEAFNAEDVRKVLGTFAFAGGSIVVFYGLIQLHDTEVHGTGGTSSSGTWGHFPTTSSRPSATPTTWAGTWP